MVVLGLAKYVIANVKNYGIPKRYGRNRMSKSYSITCKI